MIKAVMFDMGGTLEDLYSDEKNDRATAYALYDILEKHHIAVPAWLSNEHFRDINWLPADLMVIDKLSMCNGI